MAWYALAKSKICHRQEEGKTDYSYPLLATDSLYRYMSNHIYIYMYTHIDIGIYKSTCKSAVCNIAIPQKSDSWHEEFCLESHLLAPCLPASNHARSRLVQREFLTRLLILPKIKCSEYLSHFSIWSYPSVCVSNRFQEE